MKLTNKVINKEDKYFAAKKKKTNKVISEGLMEREQGGGIHR